MHEYGPQKLGNLSLPVPGYGDMQREKGAGEEFKFKIIS